MSVGHINSFCLRVCGEWGYYESFLNVELGNYYSKSTFIATLIQQENYIREYLSTLQNCLRVPGYPKISNFGYPVPEITENAQP